MRLKTMTLALAALLAATGVAQAQECNKHGGKVGSVKTVHFDSGSTAISADDRKELSAFAKRVKGNPSAEVCLVGQADTKGDAAANKRLAQRRAEAVREYLRGQGLADMPYQIVVRGEAFGGWLGDVLSDSRTDRRVEVWFIRH